jgi:hypothetical protein
LGIPLRMKTTFHVGFPTEVKTGDSTSGVCDT